MLGAGGASARDATASPDRDALEQSISEVELLVREAHFSTAIGVAEATSRWATELESSVETREALSRLHVLLATARLALGDDAGARESMDRALVAWPLLTLHERTTSPRVLALFDEARASRDAGLGRRP